MRKFKARFLSYLLLYFREPEPQILEYRTQQYKLLPNLATAFAIRQSAYFAWKMYNDVVSELEGGDLERLPEVKYYDDEISFNIYNCHKRHH